MHLDFAMGRDSFVLSQTHAQATEGRRATPTHHQSRMYAFSTVFTTLPYCIKSHRGCHDGSPS